MPGSTKITHHVTMCSICDGDVSRRLGCRSVNIFHCFRFRQEMGKPMSYAIKTNRGQKERQGGGYLIK